MRIALTLVFILAVAGAAGAGPLDAPGATKALNCAACHGPSGQSPSDAMPILAGLWPEYFKKAIQDYAAGRRPSPEMEPYAKQVLAPGGGDAAPHLPSQQPASTKAKSDAAA